jgi:hypothetical protein
MSRQPISVVAYYLGQFYPVTENDQFWGEGFTEWHNVAKARPLFPGHNQPQLPGRFGFYDLRCKETIESQLQYAEQIGVQAFCYWHYWFAGKRMLHHVLDTMLRECGSKLKFMLGWANESWTGIWHGAGNRVLIKQTYNDEEVLEHGKLLATYIRSERYLHVNGASPLVIYKPRQIPDTPDYLSKLREAVRKCGGGELYVIGNWGGGLSERISDPHALGLDAVVVTPVAAFYSNWMAQYTYSTLWRGMRMCGFGPEVRRYTSMCDVLDRAIHTTNGRAHATVVTGWDNTPRSGRRGLVLTGYNERSFYEACAHAIKHERKNEPGLLFVKSWNEWAEGNVIEPKFNDSWQPGEVLKRALSAV